MSSSHFELATEGRSSLVPITDLVRKALADSGVEDGLCVVYVPHTTAGVLINENADPDVARDVLGWFSRAVPQDPRFRHVEGNSDAHLKAILAGSSVSIPVSQGELELGTWQGIYFAEFDGPRLRRFTVSCVSG